MKKYIGILVAGLILFPANLAYAEEIVEEPVVVEDSTPEPAPEPAPETEPEPAPETEPAPEPAPSYTPPPEASEGVGGWAVVDPDTGNVHGVIVGTIDTYKWVEEQGGMGTSYMGCHSKCVLRFQSVAEDGGNVAGYHSDGYNDVKWDEGNSNFSLTDGLGRSSTLVPEKTDGRGAQSGLVDIVQKTETSAGVKIEQRQENVYDEEKETDILFPEWGEQGKLFKYLSQLEAERNLQTDIDTDLLSEGYTAEKTTTETIVDEETGEETTTETTETVIDEENAFVKTVRQWTESVFDFFRGIFS